MTEARLLLHSSIGRLILKMRILGRSLEVSAMGRGCMGMSGAYGVAGDCSEMISLLRIAVELGSHSSTRPRFMVHLCKIASVHSR